MLLAVTCLKWWHDCFFMCPCFSLCSAKLTTGLLCDAQWTAVQITFAVRFMVSRRGIIVNATALQ